MNTSVTAATALPAPFPTTLQLPLVALPTPTPSKRPAPVLILGRDDNGRPHASRFRTGDAQLAKDAADAMQMCSVAAETDVLLRLADKLPEGKIFASGKAFVPFVKQEIYDQLVAHLPVGTTIPRRKPKLIQAAGNPNPPVKPETGSNYAAVTRQAATPQRGSLPDDFTKIKVGSLVLASLARDDGWWPAIVTEDKGDGMFVLQWQDWSDWEPFQRTREQLALLHPSYNGQ
ncbi:hypothetical protein [Mesorhizobium sp. CAU 1741]|uniref:hypothetical protein n=1 Tax=Mesorhizobium sp. CAU 1741 TaxID=3140366 RepID=UPI00325A685D